MLRFTFELVGAAGLFAAAWLALRAWAKDRAAFSLVAGLGTVYLGVDELFDLHERLGRRAYEEGWPKPGFINHHDDLLTLCVAAAGLAAVVWFWREILADRWFASLFGAGLALFAAAIVWDTRADQTGTFTWWVEESLELAGAALMVSAFWWRWRRAEAVGPVGAVLEPVAGGDS